MLMKLLVSFTKGIMLAIGITLPTPEQEKAVAVIWVVAFFAMIGIILGVGWLVLTSFSDRRTLSGADNSPRALESPREVTFGLIPSRVWRLPSPPRPVLAT